MWLFKRKTIETPVPTNWIDWCKSEKNAPLMDEERIMLEITELISSCMYKLKTEGFPLSKKLGKKPKYIYCILSDKKEPSLRELSNIFRVMGYKLKFSTERVS